MFIKVHIGSRFELPTCTYMNSGGLTWNISDISKNLGVVNIHDFLGDNIQVQHTSMFEMKTKWNKNPTWYNIKFKKVFNIISVGNND